MNRQLQIALLVPGFWTALTLGLMFVSDALGLPMLRPVGLTLLVSWIVSVPATLIASLIGVTISARSWREGREVLIYGVIHLTVILVAAYLCFVAIHFPNLGGQ